MIFGLLGPLLCPSSVPGNGACRLSAAKHRSLLAILLISANRIVRVERIIDELWSDHPPESAENLIRQYVSQLRRRLRPGLRKAGHDGHLIETAPGGYVLYLRPGDLDLDVFKKQVSEAHAAVGAGNPSAAQALIDDAIGLWRGPFLADVPSSPLIAQEASRLEECKAGALELRLQTRLARSQFTELLSEVVGLVATYPRWENLRGLQMRALYGVGRRADALAAYHGFRQELVDELGIDPGPRLNAIHSAILEDNVEALQLPPAAAKLSDPVASATVRVVPAQLPNCPLDLIVDETRSSLKPANLATDEASAAQPLIVVSGMTGTGKTALAVHHSRQCLREYPDGQLFVPLNGSSGDPTDPAEALRRILWAFTSSAGQIPDRIDAAADLYRSFMAKRRALVILDDARDEAQVRPLLPGGTQNRVIVTSLRPLVGLEGARHIRIGTLSTEHGLLLLGQIADPERIQREPAAAAEIVEHCGRLPLAIRIAGGILIAHPHMTVAQLAGRLATGNILDQLSVSYLDLRDRLTANWQSLSRDLQGVLRQTAAMPANGFSSAMVACSLGEKSWTPASPRPIEQVDEDLERLAEVDLLEVITADKGQTTEYRLNSLMRAYVTETQPSPASAPRRVSGPQPAPSPPRAGRCGRAARYRYPAGPAACRGYLPSMARPTQQQPPDS